MAKDPYCYPGTETLINRLGIKDADKLRKVEQNTVLRMELEPVRNFKNSYQGFKDLHKHLFSRVYEWAGNTRADETTIKGKTFQPPAEIWKGNMAFAPVEKGYERTLKNSFKDTKKQLDQAQKDGALTPDKFGAIMAKQIGVINDHHPFREGNGRTMRLYLKNTAREYGMKLSTQRMDKKDWLEKSHRAMFGDHKPLAEMLAQNVRDSMTRAKEGEKARSGGKTPLPLFEINAAKDKPRVLKNVKGNTKSFAGMAAILKDHIDDKGDFKAFFEKMAADFAKGSPHAPGMPRYSPDNVKQNVIKQFKAQYGMAPQDYLRGREGKDALQKRRAGGVTESHLSQKPRRLKNVSSENLTSKESGRSSDKSR